MNTNASPSLYENVASRRFNSTSFSSSSERRLRSYFTPPGTLYMMKRKVMLPLRPCAALRSMSRTWYTVLLYSTTLPFFTSLAFMGVSDVFVGCALAHRLLESREARCAKAHPTHHSFGRQTHRAIEPDRLAIQIAILQDEGDRLREFLRLAQARR